MGVIVILGLLIIYTMAGAFIESSKLTFSHETTVAILIGMAVSLMAYQLGYENFSHIMKFRDSLFFFVCLPPIIFAAGYNLKRKKFFKHFNYIALFGIFGTFICYAVFSALTYAGC